MKRYTDLVAYQGQVYTWETLFWRGRMAEIAPIGGGEVIAVAVSALRMLPGPSLVPTYAHAGT